MTPACEIPRTHKVILCAKSGNFLISKNMSIYKTLIRYDDSAAFNGLVYDKFQVLMINQATGEGGSRNGNQISKHKKVPKKLRNDQ